MKIPKEISIKFTEWLLSSDDLDPPNDILLPEFKYRFFDYCLKNMTMIAYIDRHFNDIYEFNKYELTDWFLTFRDVFRKFGIKNKNQLFFISQFKTSKRVNFKKDVESTFQNDDFSDYDLNDLFFLYENDVISHQIIEYLKIVNSNKSGKKPYTIIPNPTDEESPPSQKAIINPDVLRFNATLTDHIAKNNSCRNCPLYSKEKQPTYTDVQIDDNFECDVIVISEQPFAPNDPIRVDSYIQKLIKKHELSYITSSLVLCKPDDGELPNPKKSIIKNCNNIRRHVFDRFSSKMKILIGSEVKAAFGIKGPMAQLNGQMINNNLIITDKLGGAFDKGFVALNSKLETLRNEIKRVKAPSRLELENADLTNYSLFDIKVVDEEILYIFLENETGKKKFITESISYPVYIKLGDFRNCPHTTEEVDFVTYLTNDQKRRLHSELNKNMVKTIQSVGG